MKFQDVIFLIIFFMLLLKRDSRLSIVAGIMCLFFSIPLFALWVFFTAEHLVWYAAGFFLLSITLLFNNK